ncbi:hypothetical protein TRFO_03446 [Tritrichomonas foetus]|uniref:Uncharacterized protein n=1 Tax=Tritrichomonas foetus TaxID=1144522 RepID=A0A1J4KP13_9EUKA|nr:hypothetical protein TRFO_03446 [Tritrichomonas foetus]|eukprot:OHT13033.1 hypothetical protein TRFO_03446 [Tritrichomonas foetus]
MFATPSVKIARPLNSPRSVRTSKTPRSKGRARDSRNLSEFEDQETLAKQKYDLVNEIIALRREVDLLHGQFLDREADFDEKQLYQIEFLQYTEKNKNLSEAQKKVIVYSKQLNQLQAEMNELLERESILSTLFSEDAIVRIKSEIVYEKHTIGHQRDELKAVLQVRDSANAELDSNDLAMGIQMCKNQRSHYLQLKRELKAIQEEEPKLQEKYQETLKLPQAVEQQENEIKELNQRLKNLQHSKDSKKRDISRINETYETEKDVMQNVSHANNVQRNRDRERENFSATVSSPRSGRRTGRFRTQTKPAQNKKDELSKSKTLSDDFENDFDKTGTMKSERSDNDDSEKSDRSGSENSDRHSESEKNSDSEKNSGSDSENNSGRSSGSERNSRRSSGSERNSGSEDNSEKSGSEKHSENDSENEKSEKGDGGSEDNDSEGGSEKRSDDDDEKDESGKETSDKEKSDDDEE